MGYEEEDGFNESCSGTCVAQAARNRYIHTTLGPMMKCSNREAGQGEIWERAKLAVDMLSGLCGLTFV